MTTPLETASRVEGQGPSPQDRVAVFQRGDVVVAVVADGAGGTSGGAVAATLIVEHTKRAVDSGRALLDVVLWKRVLLDADSELEERQMGQTTAVILATDGTRVVGASVGDSGAWLVGPIEWTDLTANQRRKPLLGDGVAEPVTFEHAVRPGETLLLGTDGVRKYATAERICSALRKTNLSAANCCAELLALVRLPSGGLQDDAGLVIIRVRAALEPQGSAARCFC